jgi:hypothetical protein
MCRKQEIDMIKMVERILFPSFFEFMEDEHGQSDERDTQET